MGKPVVIVGAGLAGLTCARYLHRSGIQFLLLEASGRIGGRLKTDEFEGFRLDHGFQVYFDAYPHARQELDHLRLDLRPWRSGAYVFDGQRLALIDPSRPIITALSPLFGLGDKLRLRSVFAKLAAPSPDESAERYLRAAGIGAGALDRFLRPFFGGIFLDPSLSVSAKQFVFVAQSLNAGRVVVPAVGIEAIPRQFAESLPASSLRMDSPVVAVERDGDGNAMGVKLASGEAIEASAVVVATEADAASRLTGLPTIDGAKSSVCLYFEMSEPVVDEPYLVLNGSGRGRVNEVAPVSLVVPEAAPTGRHLISATVLGEVTETDEALAASVRDEIAGWFPNKPIASSRFLRSYRIRYAQMPQPPGFSSNLPEAKTAISGLFFAGEFTTNGSIDGAIESGVRTADLVSAWVAA